MIALLAMVTALTLLAIDAASKQTSKKKRTRTLGDSLEYFRSRGDIPKDAVEMWHWKRKYAESVLMRARGGEYIDPYLYDVCVKTMSEPMPKMTTRGQRP